MPWGQANGILVISILHCHPHHHQHNSNHHNLIINPIIVITMRGLHAILRVTVVATVVVSDVDFLFFLLFFVVSLLLCPGHARVFCSPRLTGQRQSLRHALSPGIPRNSQACSRVVPSLPLAAPSLP